MAERKRTVNLSGTAALPVNIAPLTNVSMTLGALHGALNRPSHLPGLLVLYGPSGLGKSTAASAAVTRMEAYHVAVKSSWTRKAVYEGILDVMLVAPEKTAYRMEKQIATQLSLDPSRPLIIDEADFLVAKGSIELVRDIYEASGATILMIGEENLPANLQRWERIHNRVLEWIPAQLADMDDARTLRDKFCRDVAVADDLLIRIHEASRGIVRRILTNLERVREAALSSGLAAIDLQTWGDRPLNAGEAPLRRHF